MLDDRLENLRKEITARLGGIPTDFPGAHEVTMAVIVGKFEGKGAPCPEGAVIECRPGKDLVKKVALNKCGQKGFGAVGFIYRARWLNSNQAEVSFDVRSPQDFPDWETHANKIVNDVKLAYQEKYGPVALRTGPTRSQQK